MNIKLPEYVDTFDDGELHIKFDPKLDLIAIIAIHSTQLGPSLGGCRLHHYSSMDDAIYDAVRLAKGMTYKAALAHLELGGGKSVLLAPEKITDRKAYFEAFGRFVEDLGGRHITAVDSGSNIDDMENIATQTRYVASRRSNGSPSPYTAHGVFRGIQAAVKHKFHRDNLDGMHVAIQGVGSVGYDLAKELHAAGARLTVTDINQAAVATCVAEFGATAVNNDEIFSQACDVFAPCAMGAILNDVTIPKLNCDIIAGAANNQLAHDHNADQLYERGILYAPDYVINGAGVMHCAVGFTSLTYEQLHSKIELIYDTMTEIFQLSDTEKTSPAHVTDIVAQERIAKATTE